MCHVLIEDARSTAQRGDHRLLVPVLGRGMLLATGEEWRTQRHAAAPALAPRMIRGLPRLSRTPPTGWLPSSPRPMANRGANRSTCSDACSCSR